VLPHGTWVARKLERPFVVSIHDCLQSGESFRFDPRWGRRIIAVSEAVSEALLSQSAVPRDLVSVIRSGIEIDVSVPTLPVLDPGHIPVVGTACPLESVKGIPFLLGAAQRVLAEHPQTEFLISGAGPEETNLRRMARELNIDSRVTFVPNLLDFAEPLAAMDIFCLPSLQQGLGMIMLQAMGMGKPVIATDVGGVHDVVRDNENALLVRPADSRHLAERILELLNDPVRARTIAAAGRATVERDFSADRMVQQTADLYRDVLAVLLTS
jgi:glycosyltransferase involved in cell wall biosynthesis